MPLESAALQEEEAWPPKSDIGPGAANRRLRYSSPPGGEKGGVSLVESTSLVSGGFAGERVGCVWDVSL